MYKSSSQEDRLTLCPFGRILLAYQQDNVSLKSYITIFIGDQAKQSAFDDVRQGFLASFLPFGEDPTSFKWPIQNQKIIVFDTGATLQADANRLCLHLLKQEPKIIFLHSSKYLSKILLPRRE
jgi:hypothetical protein